jgi:hypothetical protein
VDPRTPGSSDVRPRVSTRLPIYPIAIAPVAPVAGPARELRSARPARRGGLKGCAALVCRRAGCARYLRVLTPETLGEP